jgi:8-oxo-dGTP pyrophosphatase MutT (NUDIX family)
MTAGQPERVADLHVEPGAAPVVAAVVCRGGRYLLGQRPVEKRHGGLWEFPGGKVHDGESMLEAVRRELAEEMGLDVVALGPVRLTVGDPGAAFIIDFVEAVAEGDAEAREHTRVAWLTPDEMADIPLAPADRLFATQLPGTSGP